MEKDWHIKWSCIKQEMQGNPLKTNEDLMYVNKDEIIPECTYESLRIFFSQNEMKLFQ